MNRKLFNSSGESESQSLRAFQYSFLVDSSPNTEKMRSCCLFSCTNTKSLSESLCCIRSWLAKNAATASVAAPVAICAMIVNCSQSIPCPFHFGQRVTFPQKFRVRGVPQQNRGVVPHDSHPYYLRHG